MPIRRVPEDIIIDIFEWVYNHSDHYRTLPACALVHSSWTPHAQKILFRAVTYYGEDLAQWSKLLIESFSSNPLFGTCVRSLQVLVASDRFIKGGLNFTSEDQLITILECCPQLVELGIAFAQVALSPPVLARLAPLGRHIERLTWKGVTESAVLYQLFEIWPAIRFLRIESAIFNHPPAAHRPAFALEVLVIHAPVNSYALEWLLAPSPERPTLALDISADFTDERAEDVLIACGPHIRTLATVRAQRALLDALPALETLVLYVEPRSALALPPGVALGFHPRYDNDGRGTLPRLAAAISAQGGHRPRCFAVNKRVSAEARDVLRAVCEREGVEFSESPASVAASRFTLKSLWDED